MTRTLAFEGNQFARYVLSAPVQSVQSLVGSSLPDPPNSSSRRLHVRLVVHRLHVRAESRAQHRVPGQRDERRHAVRLEDCPALLLALDVDVLRPLKTLVPQAPQAEAAVVEHVLPESILTTARRLILALGLQEELVGLPVLFLGRVGRLRHGAPGGDRIGGLSAGTGSGSGSGSGSGTSTRTYAE